MQKLTYKIQKFIARKIRISLTVLCLLPFLRLSVMAESPVETYVSPDDQSFDPAVDNYADDFSDDAFLDEETADDGSYMISEADNSFDGSDLTIIEEETEVFMEGDMLSVPENDSLFQDDGFSAPEDDWIGYQDDDSDYTNAFFTEETVIITDDTRQCYTKRARRAEAMRPGVGENAGMRFGDQLTSSARAIYDALNEQWGDCRGGGIIYMKPECPLEFSAQGEIKDGEFVWIGRSDPGYQEAVNSIRSDAQSAVDAFIYDHPEVYWLKRAGFATGQSFIILDGGTVTGCIDEIRITGVEWWSGAVFQLEAFREAVEAAVAELSSGSFTQLSIPEKLKLIHDYVCSHTDYGDNTYAHSAYGFFLGTYGAVVCDGYAKTFKILCDKLNLPCLLVGGCVNKAGTSEGHMWNYVCLEDAAWYAVDATWDDNNSRPAMYFLAGSSSAGVYGTFNEERTVYTRFSGSIYTQNFTVPGLSDGMYHMWMQETYVEATCVHDGYRIERCSLCNETHVEDITGGTHVWPEKWIIPVPAGCLQPGERQRKCIYCSEVQTEIIPPAGHQWPDEWEIETALTCTAAGSRIKRCIRCGEVSRETIPPTGHTWSGTWETMMQPSCSEEGYARQLCTYCGTIRTQTLSAVGHMAGGWITIKEATVFKKGLRVKPCVRCGARLETETIAKVKPYITFNRRKSTIKAGKKKKLFKIKGMAKGDRVISWKSGNSRILRVGKKGMIYAKKKGRTYVTVTLKSGLRRRLTVIVK